MQTDHRIRKMTREQRDPTRSTDARKRSQDRRRARDLKHGKTSVRFA